MQSNPPAVEFDLDDVTLPEVARARTVKRIASWMRGHTDITGASIALRRGASGRTPYVFQARVVLYHRPENIAAHARGIRPGTALQNALSAAERQLRTQRDVLRERWKHAS